MKNLFKFLALLLMTKIVTSFDSSIRYNTTILDVKNFSILNENLLDNSKKVTYINLSQQNLNVIPEIIVGKFPNLQVLELDGNLIKSIEPEKLKNLSKLEILSLSNNKLVDLKPKTFDDLISLTILDLSKNNLRSLEKNIFKKLTELKVLNLKGNFFTSLPRDLLQWNMSLRIIMLQYNLLKTLPSAIFMNLSDLKELYLGNNALENLSDFIFHELRNLEILNLQKNKFTKINRSFIQKLISLKEFDASDNQIEDIEKYAFFELPKLRIIKLSNNKISDISLGKLSSLPKPFSIFDTVPSLKELHLSHNKISMIYYEWTDGHKNELEFLDLSYNNLTKVELTDLKPHSVNFTMNLSHNKITEIEIFETNKFYLFESEHHVFVNISDNPIGCEKRALYGLSSYLNGSLSKEVEKILHLQIGNLQCATPEKSKGLRVADLNKKDLRFDIREFEWPRCFENCDTQVNIDEKMVYVDCFKSGFPEIPKKSCSYGDFDIELSLRRNNWKNFRNSDKKVTIKLKHHQIERIISEN